MGVALGTAIPNVVYAGYLVVTVCRALDVPVYDYVAYVFARPLLGALPVLVLLFVLRDGLDVRVKSRVLCKS